MENIFNNLGLPFFRKPLPLDGKKIFCIGRNKTGTTSIQKAFVDLGFRVGDQRTAELLYDKHYYRREFRPFVDYCRSAQVFQDIPFSCPYLYVTLDQAFPGSKFILSVRKDSDQWYSSITRFYSKLWGADGELPTADQLRSALYMRPGFAYELMKLYGTNDHEPFHKPTLTSHYERYNAGVKDYFAHRPADLLVIDVGEPGSYQRFIDFLGISSPFKDFPWENKT
jgi:hypothetical protein